MDKFVPEVLSLAKSAFDIFGDKGIPKNGKWAILIAFTAFGAYLIQKK